jgi:hypothetical protein
MTDAPLQLQTPSTSKTLRRLFLTLFLRGRASRGLQKETAPKSIGRKLLGSIAIYALVGVLALSFVGKPVFALAIYLHAMTFIFLGMFVAASAGEVLFNKEEGDILLHRPVTASSLLWAKVSVLIQVSLWLAGAFNLVGLFVGLSASDGANFLFPLAHAASTVAEALFCTGVVVLAYQLCLRFFGRERLEGLMTTAQVLIAIAAVIGGQILPRVMFQMNGLIKPGPRSWWVWVLPPAWFAGLDDAIAGTRGANSWGLAALGLAATAAVLWFAFGKLAASYERGLQTLRQAAPPKPSKEPSEGKTGRGWLHALLDAPPLSWWMRDPVERAAFVLSASYLLRDRDVKLRIYPGIAPMLVMPVIFLFQEFGKAQQPHESTSGFGLAFAGVFVGVVPLLAMDLMRYSQQWRAADLFRAAPMNGPGALCQGARRAVLLILTLPLLVALGIFAWFMSRHDSVRLLLLVPGVLLIPIYSLIPCLGANPAVPLSHPTEEAKSASRGVVMILAMMASALMSGIAIWAWSTGWFGYFLLAEAVVVLIAWQAMSARVRRSRWRATE